MNPDADEPTCSVKELEQRIADSKGSVSSSVLRELRRDPRLGAQRLYRKLKQKLDREKQERARIESMLHFEGLLWRAGLSRVAGVDEVGIGPMAGPVVAAAVVFPPGTRIEGVDDSKKLPAAAREALDAQIRMRASGIGIGVIEPEEVDRLNVYHAGLTAMSRAVRSLPDSPEHVLVDSRTIPDLETPQSSFAGGDGLSFSIASASIVAKVHRDRLMTEMAARFPGYGFAEHKGYCTPAHQAAVKRLGPCRQHRRSFNFIRELRGEYDDLFYSLREELQSVVTIDDLNGWEGRFKRIRALLSKTETRKLSSVAARRRKRMESRDAAG